MGVIYCIRNATNNKCYVASSVKPVLRKRQRNGKWRAEIKHKGVHYNLGQYANINDAIYARKEAERRLRGI